MTPQRIAEERDRAMVTDRPITPADFPPTVYPAP